MQKQRSWFHFETVFFPVRTLLGLTIFFATLAASAWNLPASPDNPQGAIWALQESGESEKARLLEHQIENILLTEPITEVTKLSSRTSPAFIVRFSKNIFAVMKEDDPVVKNSHRFDRAAYVVDRALNTHLVPMTVVREIQGKKYSLQLYYPQNLQTTLSVDQTEFNSAKSNTLRHLDLLIGNADRILGDLSHPELHNAVIGSDGRLIAIDHSRTFAPLKNKLPTQFPIDSTSLFIHGLRQLHHPETQAELRNYLNSDELALLMERANDLSQKLQSTLTYQRKEQDPTKIPLDAMNLESFKTPEEFVNKRYVDMFAMERLLGPESQKMSNNEINEIFKANSHYWRSLNRVPENWQYYPRQLKELLLPEIMESKTFLEQNQSFVVKALQIDPQYFDLFINNNTVRRSAFNALATAALSLPNQHLTDAHIQRLIEPLVSHYKTNRLGIRFNTSFYIPPQVMVSTQRQRILKHLHQQLILAGLGHQLISFFRLYETQNKNILTEIIQAYPEAERTPVAKSIQEAVAREMPQMIGKYSLQSLQPINDELARLQISTKGSLCQNLFL